MKNKTIARLKSQITVMRKIQKESTDAKLLRQVAEQIRDMQKTLEELRKNGQNPPSRGTE